MSHPEVQLRRIQDVRDSVKARNDALAVYQEAERNLLATVDRAQRAGVSYRVLLGETPEGGRVKIPTAAANSPQALRRKISEYRKEARSSTRTRDTQ